MEIKPKSSISGLLAILIILSGVAGFLQIQRYQEQTEIKMIVPPKTVSIPNPIPRPKPNKLEEALKRLQAPEEKIQILSKSIMIASNATNIDAVLLAVLMKTESEFNPKAISSKGYKGLMQTPRATFIYPEVDTLHGAMILRDKLTETKGDMPKALALYKGGNNPLARKYARDVLDLYNKTL